MVERGLAPTRTRAQALVMAGRVRVGTGDSGRTDRKPGDLLAEDSPVEVLADDPFVSRGAHKLEAALDAFGVNPAGRVCLDVGASTGGFTDALLARGAARVYAVDVGRGQLADRLRGDPRVVSMERTNARILTPELLGGRVTVAVVDVSFISLALVLGPTAGCFDPAGGDLVALVKPQFEAGKGQTDAGVVRDPAIHRAVLERVARDAATLGLALRGAIASPLLGPAGNREFLLGFAVAGSAAHDPVPLDAAWLARFDDLVAR
jgi:23S rRNA (cytidine1920-2'-O)/16S rRNA (cytidine1409-2'-O)-methyltransferase